mmetsp:Transcript_43145/g.101365  ORF Transcript_43145/g.101365 Transcript_43145/m.101365 type:complete len:833 (+) Transcript_43145:86-2584(+)|eukprot:CAMPEP_0178411548 /NCGR_PEP_ID=MMETSP0689_2-20121128/21549_1 /TAXON_ID=160604 /ORGANISM="Amphidinium massartii, Strain CS-259" /LENGTH=832 /DNA_ID=CAMNT_0020032753 /DNA_START=70 /DNA_END=2568 /DNA_ORIENTATION=-
MAISQMELEDLASDKVEILKKFLAAEPPQVNGEALLQMWDELYDEQMKSIVVETVKGPSDDATNPVFPYEKIQAVVGDGGNWKWPRMWQKFDELERRGTAFREGEGLNFEQPNKNPNIEPQNVLIVGSGPVGLRLAIELVLGGHKVTIFEKRREIRSADGALETLGFTNRVNRPHMWPFVRNDLARLNGKDLMSRTAAYPVFTEPDTSSIGIDELQILLMKSMLLLGVDHRLGVGYVNAKPTYDPKSMRPRWRVECTYDAAAAKKFGMPEGKTEQVFDCLIGCDGPRSAVRETQAKHFGNIEKRKFMDCVGIVANVRKVSRKRLKELGFEYGQEPHDMNRTKMVFKDFFTKINEEADADLEGLIYYKASFHNYTILTPKRSDLVKHGLSGKVYHHTVAREASSMNAERMEEKAKLKKYCANILKAAGIPVDDQLENGGFVDAPNDVMAFDFAECWNTPKSLVFNLPPADYDVEAHGEWMGRRLIPLVGLAGDALLEPFWPLGLGLKRGWQAIMDTCYAIDNLYNRTLFAARKGKDAASFTWDDHYEALQDQIAVNFEYCSRLKVGDELGKGEYAEKGPVMTQLKKMMKDAERPPFEVEIDPWTRYAPLEKEDGDKWKLMMKDEKWVHPKVKKLIAMKAYYDEQGRNKSGEVIYKGKKLISVSGRVVGGKQGGGYQPPQKRPSQVVGVPLRTISQEAVAQEAMKKQESLRNAVMASKIEDHVKAKSSEKTVDESKSSIRRASVRIAPESVKDAASKMAASVMDHLAHVPPPSAEEDSYEEAASAMWNRMTEKDLSPAQKADLDHVRNMIAALTKSLESYKAQEQQLLLAGKGK